MADNSVAIGFDIDTGTLDAGLQQATGMIARALAAIDAQLGGLRDNALGAYGLLKTLADEPTSNKALQDRYAAEVTQVEKLKALHQISADEAIRQEARIEEAKYAALRGELEASLSAMGQEAAARQALQAKADALEVGHNAKMRALDLQAVRQSEQSWRAIVAPISGAFQSSINGLIQGHETLRQALARTGKSIVTQFADMAWKRVTSWITSELAMTDATNVGNAARTASDGAAAASSSGFSFDKALKEIGANAARVYSSVFAWASPALGPFAAIPAAAASALVIAKEALVPSAAGGFDIPAGLNPLTQLHEREMVLPADIAEPLRQSLAGGGASSGGDIHIHAVDAAGIQRLLSNNKGALARALREAVRGFDPALRFTP